MISRALTLICNELREYLEATSPSGAPDVANGFVKLGNIALLDNPDQLPEDQKINDRVVISIVNLEEEKRLKNKPTFVNNGSEVVYNNPSINLNLYILFSANYSRYDLALRRLSQVIEFFQGKNYFDQNNSPDLALGTHLNLTGGLGTNEVDQALAQQASELELHMEIHTLNFEQINDLWGSLGGKQVPFVMYKMRILCIRRPDVQATTPSIDNVTGDLANN